MGLARTMAPFGAALVVLIWVIAEIKKYSRRRTLESCSNIDSLRALSWQEFEQLVGEAYRRRGFVVAESGGGGPDGGVDLVLTRNGVKTLVQCKQWRTWKVGVKIVRELYGVMTAEGAGQGIVATCGSFTADAKAFRRGQATGLGGWAGLVETGRRCPDQREAGSCLGRPTEGPGSSYATPLGQAARGG